MDFSLAWQKLNQIGHDLMLALPNIVFGLVVFVGFMLLARGVRALVQRVTRSKNNNHNLSVLLSRLAYVAMLVLGVLVTVTIILPGFTPASLVSALGVGGIAIGFAFKDIFQNFLAGILLLLTEPFKIGDQIKYQDFEGTVEDIQTRATAIKTYDGRRVIIPNAELFTNAVTVNTAYDKRRLQYDVGIGYGDDIARARELMLEAMRETAGVLQDPAPDALVMDLAESSVNIRARWWVDPPRQADVLDAQDKVLEAIKNKLSENGIDLPFPTRQILFHDQTEATDGNRRQQREGWPAGQGDVPPARAEVARPSSSQPGEPTA
ncbi:mechanosensitive ion channel family protein [Hymenobacter elongatus]|uniref:Mechanosensitive ion channel family protein n=1 Tax=Hymenobacter elongatus TaxID=877208 RepID=A0A4Z0PMC4_9BACT|nr:mechanosensitive ion channel family protein [Hymenobacter elongatus]TGE17365.1 mechanosensitive ion channel family protein [Hymenobacter elongatus]